MKKTVHVVSKIGWEYNDEYFFRPECGGGTPVKGYLSLVEAQEECDRLNKEATKDSSDYFVREPENDEERDLCNENDEWGIPITEVYEVITVELED